MDTLEDQNLNNKWYADDGNTAGSLKSLCIPLDELNEHGGAFCYNVLKCNLVTKPEQHFFERLVIELLQHAYDTY